MRAIKVNQRRPPGAEWPSTLRVATALRLGGGVVLTHDPSDLDLSVAGRPNVRVVAI